MQLAGFAISVGLLLLLGWRGIEILVRILIGVVVLALAGGIVALGYSLYLYFAESGSAAAGPLALGLMIVGGIIVSLGQFDSDDE